MTRLALRSTAFLELLNLYSSFNSLFGTLRRVQVFRSLSILLWGLRLLIGRFSFLESFGVLFGSFGVLFGSFGILFGRLYILFRSLSFLFRSLCFLFGSFLFFFGLLIFLLAH